MDFSVAVFERNRGDRGYALEGCFLGRPQKMDAEGRRRIEREKR